MRPFIGIAIERRKENTLAEKDHLPVSNSRVDSPKSDMVGNLNKSNYFCRLHILFNKLETRVDRNQLRSKSTKIYLADHGQKEMEISYVLQNMVIFYL